MERGIMLNGLRAVSVLRWYCIVIGMFLGLRAISTLLAGASFAAPGDGWRAVFQLGAVALLAAGLGRSRLTRGSVVIVGIAYLAATVLELFDGTSLLGAIPVDARDRVVHPLIAIAAGACLAVAWHRMAARRPGLADEPGAV
jgi:hypothetical protein